MRGFGKRSVLSIIYRVLLAVFAVMALAWLGGTVWALFFRAAETAVPAGSPPAESAAFEARRIFTGIGRLRLSPAPPSSAIVIVSVTFPYDSGDRAFSEELASRAPDFRKALAEYFGSFSAAVLQNRDEAEIKADILSRFNAILRLGKIEILYFDDFMVVD